MPSSRSIEAGNAFIRLFIKNDLARGLRPAQRILQGFSSFTSALGREISLFAGVPITAGLGLAVRTATTFEDAMSKVRAVTQGTNEQFEELRQQAKELGRTTPFTAAQVGLGQVELGRAGLQAEEVRDATADVLALARATDTELARAAEIAVATMRQFNLEAKDAANITDILVGTVNNSSQGLEDFAESMKLAGPAARDAEIPIERVAASLGLLANFGIKGSIAGTAFRRFVQQIANSDVREKIREQLQLEISDADFRELDKTIGKIFKRLSELEPENLDRAGVLVELFGARAFAAAGNIGRSSEIVDEFSEKLRNLDGIAKITAETMDDNLGGGFRRLKSAIEGIQISFVESFGDSLADLVDDTAKWVSGAADFIEKNRDVGISILKVAGAILGTGGLLIAVGALTYAISNPAGLLFVAAAIGAVFAEQFGLLDEFKDKVRETTDEVVASMSEAFGFATLAAENNDIATAFELLLVEFKLQYQKLVAELKREFIRNPISDIGRTLAEGAGLFDPKEFRKKLKEAGASDQEIEDLLNPTGAFFAAPNDLRIGELKAQRKRLIAEILQVDKEADSQRAADEEKAAKETAARKEARLAEEAIKQKILRTKALEDLRQASELDQKDIADVKKRGEIVNSLLERRQRLFDAQGASDSVGLGTSREDIDAELEGIRKTLSAIDKIVDTSNEQRRKEAAIDVRRAFKLGKPIGIQPPDESGVLYAPIPKALLEPRARVPVGAFDVLSNSLSLSRGNVRLRSAQEETNDHLEDIKKLLEAANQKAAKRLEFVE